MEVHSASSLLSSQCLHPHVSWGLFSVHAVYMCGRHYSWEGGGGAGAASASPILRIKLKVAKAKVLAALTRSFPSTQLSRSYKSKPEMEADGEHARLAGPF